MHPNDMRLISITVIQDEVDSAFVTLVIRCCSIDLHSHHEAERIHAHVMSTHRGAEKCLVFTVVPRGGEREDPTAVDDIHSFHEHDGALIAYQVRMGSFGAK